MYYKFLFAERVAPNTGYQWPEPGEWTPAVSGALIACENGYHLCRPQDLSRWISKELWECEADAEILEDENKIVTRSARLLRRVGEWNDRTQRLFACDCAERALGLIGNQDPRSVDAVRVARLYAEGDATKEQLDAAGDAAGDAARAAAWDAARAAAWAAAWDAAGDAAWAAAWDAARTAAGDAARAWQSERIMYYIGGRS